MLERLGREDPFGGCWSKEEFVRKARITLETQELQLHREERAEERAAWTDEQPLTREDRDIHKTTLEQEQRRKRIDELM